MKIENSQDDSKKIEAQYFLDITSEICPMTFVRTKLLIERMEPGEIAEVRLTGAEPTKNVPRSITQHGHRVLSMEAEPSLDGSEEIFCLIFQKNK